MPLSEQDRELMFNKVKVALQKCCPPMVHKKGSADAYELMGNKPVPYGYKKEIVPGMYFASAVMRKDRVSFYFFPCYMKPEPFKDIAPNIFKCLTGKTCFQLKKMEHVNEKELDAMLKKGVEVWKKLGYMK